MLILDGGLGLVKVSLIYIARIHIMKHVRTPLHDHVRKVRGWSNTQTVYRFAIIQIILAAAVISTFLPSSLNLPASFPTEVVLPTPLTPITMMTDWRFSNS